MNKILINAIRGEPKIILAYLFGSRAQGRVGELSDYDVAILVDGKVADDFRYRFGSRLCKELNTAKVDLIILNSVPIELAYNVISTGKLIYQQSVSDRVEFEANTLSKYFDYLPVLRKQREELLRESNYETGIQRRREALRKTERMLTKLGAPKGKRDWEIEWREVYNNLRRLSDLYDFMEYVKKWPKKVSD